MKRDEKIDGKCGKKIGKKKKIEEREGGKKILLLTKCKGHSLMQRWGGKVSTKRKKVLRELLEARKTTLLTRKSTKERVRTHVLDNIRSYALIKRINAYTVRSAYRVRMPLLEVCLYGESAYRVNAPKR